MVRRDRFERPISSPVAAPVGTTLRLPTRSQLIMKMRRELPRGGDRVRPSRRGSLANTASDDMKALTHSRLVLETGPAERYEGKPSVERWR